jgi:hypothetical protein
VSVTGGSSSRRRDTLMPMSKKAMALIRGVWGVRRSALRSGLPPREDPLRAVSRTSTAIPARRQTPTMNTCSLLAGGGRDTGSCCFDCS